MMLSAYQKLAVLSIFLTAFLADANPRLARAQSNALRTWSDASGKFKIKAKMIKVEEGTVTLENEDGEELEIELKKLTVADQKFVADSQKAAADSPFKSKKDSPFKSKSKKATGGKGAERSSEDAADPQNVRTVKVDWGSADQVSLVAPSDKWEAPAPETVEGFSTKPKNVPLPNKSNFFEALKGLAISRVAKKAAVGYVLAERGGGTTRVVLCDLVTGKCGTPAVSPGQYIPLAVHDDGRQILMCRDEGWEKTDLLEIWTPQGTKVNKKVAWTPYADEKGFNRDVMWAEFIDETHLATSSRLGKVAIWKFPEIEPICTFTAGNGSFPALSPDRKFIAYCTGTDIGLFSVEKREVIAQQPVAEHMPFPHLAFSPSGKRLGCVAFDKILVWDTVSGKLEYVVPCPGINVNGSIDFPEEGYILAGGRFLIELENQVKLWTYDGQDRVLSTSGWTFFAVSDGDRKPGVLAPGHVPHPTAATTLAKALADGDLFVLKAGVTVKLNLAGIPDAQREAARAGLTKQLETIGCKAGDNGTIELVATVEGPKERDISFIARGTYKMQEYLTRAKFVFNGESLWESLGSNVPGIVSLKRGENMDGHLKSLEKPDVTFFERVKLPKLLQKPSGTGPQRQVTLGTSRMTTGGIRE